MTARDYLAEAEVVSHVGEQAHAEVSLSAVNLTLLGIGQQLRRIADQMEPHTLLVAEGVETEAQFPNLQIRAYLAREGRI